MSDGARNEEFHAISQRMITERGPTIPQKALVNALERDLCAQRADDFAKALASEVDPAALYGACRNKLHRLNLLDTWRAPDGSRCRQCYDAKVHRKHAKYNKSDKGRARYLRYWNEIGAYARYECLSPMEVRIWRAQGLRPQRGFDHQAMRRLCEEYQRFVGARDARDDAVREAKLEGLRLTKEDRR